MTSALARQSSGGSGTTLPSGTRRGHWVFTPGEADSGGFRTPRDRWDRPDGASVQYSKDWYWANPANPRHKGWTAYGPEDEHPLYYTRRISRLKRPRRWKSPEAAMAAVDREFPWIPGRKNGGRHEQRS